MLSPSAVHIDRIASDLIVGYRPEGMIWDQIFPVVNVTKQSDLYAKIDKGNWFRRPETNRGPGTLPNEINYTVSSARYACTNRELATRVPDETIHNADSPHQPIAHAGMQLMDGLMIDAEIRIRDAVDNGVGSSSTLTGGNAWNQFNTSDPVTDLEVAREAIRSTTGRRPNTLIVPEKVWLKMRRHPDIVKLIYPGAGIGGMVSPEQFGSVIFPNGGRVLIPSVIHNTAAEAVGVDAPTFSDVWSTNVYLAHVTGNPGPFNPSFGYAFRWTGSDIPNFAVQQYRPEEGRSKTHLIQVGYYQDEHVCAPELGFRIATGITA